MLFEICGINSEPVALPYLNLLFIELGRIIPQFPSNFEGKALLDLTPNIPRTALAADEDINPPRIFSYPAFLCPPFIACSSGRFAAVASLFTTNSPGVSIAGTVSVLPVPGTMFPSLNLFGIVVSVL